MVYKATTGKKFAIDHLEFTINEPKTHKLGTTTMEEILDFLTKENVASIKNLSFEDQLDDLIDGFSSPSSQTAAILKTQVVRLAGNGVSLVRANNLRKSLEDAGFSGQCFVPRRNIGLRFGKDFTCILDIDVMSGEFAAIITKNTPAPTPAAASLSAAREEAKSPDL